MGMVASILFALLAYSLEIPEMQTQGRNFPVLVELPALGSSLPNRSSLSNGTYLYGEVTEPEQIGKGYLVFEVRQGKVIGALYMPFSSFDCFYGSFKSEQLLMTIVDTFEKTTYPFSINLLKFYPISPVSSNDYRILGVCKNQYQKQIWGE